MEIIAQNKVIPLSEVLPEQGKRQQAISEPGDTLPASINPADEQQKFRVSIHRRSTAPEDRILLHTHNFYKTIYCRQVPDMEYLVGTHRYRIRSGDFLYIPPGILHRPIFGSNCKEPFVRDELWLRNDYVDSFGNRLPADTLSNRKTPYLIRMSLHCQQEIEDLIQKCAKENDDREFRWDSALEGYATLILVTMCRALLDECNQLLRQEGPNLFDTIMAYMEANLSRRITLDEVSERFFVSKSTINRTFQKHMGTSFYRCLTQRKLLAAQRLILEGTTLDRVSIEVGFADYATFYRAFKQEFGISPRQFKKNQDSFCFENQT